MKKEKRSIIDKSNYLFVYNMKNKITNILQIILDLG